MTLSSFVPEDQDEKLEVLFDVALILDLPRVPPRPELAVAEQVEALAKLRDFLDVDPVMVGDREVHISQGNNVYVFPGVGLGALAIGASRITDGMFTAAAHALAEQVSSQCLSSGALYPPVASLRDVTLKIAVRVAQAAVTAGVAEKPSGEIEDIVAQWVWDPQYPELVPR